MWEMAHRITSNKVLITIGVVISLLVVVAVVFALQPPTQFDPSSPEGTTQGYFQALNDGDKELAESFMTDDLARACEGAWWYYETDESSRVLITGTQVTAESAKVQVNITVSYGEGPFGGGSYDEDETVVMERQGEVWLISEPVWPMDRYTCRKEGG